MRLLSLLFCSLVACWGQVRHDQQHHAHHAPRRVEEWITILETPDRDGWQKPEQVVQALGLRPGMAVADIGAGSGYFAVRFAEAVGQQGTVYANDIDAGLVEHLRQRAAKLELNSLKPVHGQPDDPMLPPASVDLIFICDVVHHIENRGPYYRKLAAAMRPGGRLAIVDFHKRELPVGPPPAMKIDKPDLISELDQAGFALREEFDFLPYQYFLVFEPK
jgi:ubiquinone/menaquinone biosynthesis C-methylase UbiE